MKKLMIAMAMCLAAAAASAAQCEGKTLQGERCKREAAEGSKFCIGHAGQAKKPAAAKQPAQSAQKQPEARLKDDGTCWAVTERGTRCKHKKDGEKDYCKMHAADRKVKISPSRCRALTYEGTRCSRAPEPGYNFCAQHGAPVPKKGGEKR